MTMRLELILSLRKPVTSRISAHAYQQKFPGRCHEPQFVQGYLTVYLTIARAYLDLLSLEKEIDAGEEEGWREEQMEKLRRMARE